MSAFALGVSASGEFAENSTHYCSAFCLHHIPGHICFISSYLVDLKFREESVEAVDLLSFLDKCVVLGDALQGELVHQVDLVRLLQVLPHEGLHSQGEGGAVEQNLATLGQEADDLVQHPLEVLAEQLVCLV